MPNSVQRHVLPILERGGSRKTLVTKMKKKHGKITNGFCVIDLLAALPK
jgi:hypothetical protein